MRSIPSGAPIEVVGCLAHVIPSRVICSILDISDSLAPQMLAGIDRIAGFFGNLPPSEIQFDEARIALQTMKCSFMSEFEKKPSKVIEKREESDPRIAALTSVALLFAAVETTRSAIAASLYRLGIQPELMERLRGDRKALPSFIEEVLRFDSPSQFMSRMAKSSIPLGGLTVKIGEPIVFFIGAANRDPARFKNPDVFDMDREDNRHLAFGVGAHYCLGAHLARLEIRETLDAMLSRCSAIEILEKPTWSQNKNFRGISSLRVRLVE